MSGNSEVSQFDKLLQPIPGENPSGQNLREQDDLTFHNIEQARKADDLFNRGEWERKVKAAEWDKVLELTQQALLKKTKDLRIAVYLLEASVNTSGFAGLRDGLRLVRELLSRFWDTLHPDIEDGDLDFRAGQLMHINTKLPAMVRQVAILDSDSSAVFSMVDVARVQELNAQHPDNKNLSADDQDYMKQFNNAVSACPRAAFEVLHESLTDCESEIDLLDEVVDEKFTEDPPGLSKLREQVEECHLFVRTELANRPEPPATGARAQATNGETAPAGHSAAPEDATQQHVSEREADDRGTPLPAEDSSSETKQPDPVENGEVATAPEPSNQVVLVEQDGTTPSPVQSGALRQTILDTACALRREQPDEPESYLVLRAIRWGEVRARAGYLDAAFLSAPDRRAREQLRNDFDNSRKSALLENAETWMATEAGRGWLDLQFYTCKALAGLGSGKQKVKHAIISELRAYLQEVEELPRLELSDGSPTACDATLRWLKSEIMPAPDKDQSSGSANAVGGISQETWDEAAIKVKSGQLAEGVGLLKHGVAQCQAERDRFLGRLQIAELCLAANKPGHAKPILQELVSQIEEFALEKWESPQVNVRVWQALHRCYGNRGNLSAAEQEQAQIAFDKLCQLDVEQALAISEE